jgi:hypothetical protein
MIRLGSLGGYLFDGPRLLGGWIPPGRPAVYAIMRLLPDNRYPVIYVGHSPDLSGEGFPFRHPHASRWITRAGSKWKVHVAFYEVPGGTEAHRETIVNELIAVYRPSCNSQQYVNSWRPEWIPSDLSRGSPKPPGTDSGP